MFLESRIRPKVTVPLPPLTLELRDAESVLAIFWLARKWHSALNVVSAIANPWREFSGVATHVVIVWNDGVAPLHANVNTYGMAA